MEAILLEQGGPEFLEGSKPPWPPKVDE